ncbi:IS1 family transposase [Methylobacterium sp. BTF04]|nr:IS1 family transposase [Methylobacterium sp. BTF04]NEU14612.1 IS1 family transposase [Methylobacterium sp. BTF04]
MGKDETHGIERDNARQRHWLARFRRRSIGAHPAKAALLRGLLASSFLVI